MKLDKVLKEIEKDIRQTLKNVDDSQVQDLVEKILDANRTFVFGMGRSGFMAGAFAMRLMHLNRSAYVVGETTTPLIEKGDLLVVCSASGESVVSHQITSAAHKAGAIVFALTCYPESPIGQLADGCIKLNGPTKKDPTVFESVQPAGSPPEQGMLIILDAVVICLMERLGLTKEYMLSTHTNLE